MMHLALSHTILIHEEEDVKAGKPVDTYSAQSPDELALVNAAKAYGIEFKHRPRSDMIDIQVKLPYEKNSMLLRFQILHIFEFTSKRKRMSVVVKCVNPPSGLEYLSDIKVLTKGADAILEKRISQNEENKSIMEATKQYLQSFAKDGLRTLLICERSITQEVYDEWL